MNSQPVGEKSNLCPEGVFYVHSFNEIYFSEFP